LEHELALLRLLQLADSALPVGSTAHSFGLESVIEDGLLSGGDLESFLGHYLQENGAMESGFCRAAHQLAQLSGEAFSTAWRDLNQRLSARKAPRESRDASLALGRRFLALTSHFLLRPAMCDTESHHVTAFGLVTALAGIGERTAVLAWLHQSMTVLISATQRLTPLGQTRASSILWSLKPLLTEISQTSTCADADCFVPIPEIASMRHAKLTTRLFIS
jgi:urease accessory protein